MNQRFHIFNLKTKKSSRRSWKTYNGALGNIGKYDVVSTPDGILWAISHPEWCDERLKLIKTV